MATQDLAVLAVQAILQFLENNEMHEAADTLSVESGIEFDKNQLPVLTSGNPEENVLLSALQLLIDKNQKKTVAQIEEQLTFLRGSSGSCTSKIAELTFSSNVLVSEFLPNSFHTLLGLPELVLGNSSVLGSSFLCLVGTFDKNLTLYKVTPGVSTGSEELFSVTLPSPALTVDIHPTLPLAAVGCMAGEMIIFSFGPEGITKVAQEKLSHTFVYGVRFDKTGQMCAAVTRDGRVVTFDVSKGTDTEFAVKKLGDFSAEGSPMCLEFLSQASIPAAVQPGARQLPGSYMHHQDGDRSCERAHDEVLCLARNGTNHLSLVCPVSGRRLGRIPLNGQDFDLGVAFNVLSLRRLPPAVVERMANDPDCSAAHKDLLLAGTDQGRVLLLAPPAPEHVRSYFNLNSGLLTVVVARWSHDGAHVVSNAFDQGQMAVFDSPSARLAHRVDAHQQALRCLACHPEAPLWVTGSFDKTVRFWVQDKDAE